MEGDGAALRRLAELERRFDGPIPEPLRRIAALGSAERVLLLEAEGQAMFFRALIRDQIEAIRRHRKGRGGVPESLLRDLALYRRQELFWRREAARLQAIVQPRLESVT
jgi:hypothetical protein